MPVETKNTPLTMDDSAHLNMSYSNLNQSYPSLKKIEVNGYTSFIGGVPSPWTNSKRGDNTGNEQLDSQNMDADVFAVFMLAQAKKKDYKESSWKIHVSIHPEDMGKAWDLIYPILIKNQAPHFKTVRNNIAQRLLQDIIRVDEQFLTAHHLSAYNKELAIRDNLRVTDGMQITIYIPEGKEKKYNKLVEAIEPILYLQGIRPGIIDQSDRALGLYSSIRCVGEVYKSHEKVSGYKEIEETDPFRPVGLIWDKIQIKWDGLAYEKHIARAKLTLQQVIDAERKYKNATFTKKEFVQVYDVAMEYFKRWQKLLEKAPKLSAQDQQGFDKLKKWMTNGCRLLPTIKKDDAKKIKEAEDALKSSFKMNLFPLVPLRQLQRKNAQFNLKKHLKKPLNTDNTKNEEISAITTPVQSEPSAIDSSVPVKAVESSAEVLQKLFLHRKNSFNELNNDTVPPTNNTNLEQESPDKVSALISHPIFNQGKLLGGVVGFSLGLFIALCLMPWTLGLSALILPLSPLIGTIAGTLIGWGTESCLIEHPSEPEKESLVLESQPAPVHDESAMGAPPVVARGLRMFDSKKQAPLEDGEQNQLVAQGMNL